MPPAPTFPRSSAWPEGSAFFFGRIGIVRSLATSFSPSRVSQPSASLLGRAPNPVPAAALRPHSVPVGFGSSLRLASTLSVLPVGTSLLRRGISVSDRQTGQQFHLGPGSRFLRPKAPVPPDGFRKVGSASALEQLPRASSFGRPAISFAASILTNIGLVGPGCGLELPSLSGRPLPATN